MNNEQMGGGKRQGVEEDIIHLLLDHPLKSKKTRSGRGHYTFIIGPPFEIQKDKKERDYK